MFCAAPAKLPHLDHRHPGVHDPVEDDEVDRDRRVVLGDRGLVRDLQVELAEVDPDALVDERDQQDEPGSLRADRAPEPEHHQPLVLADDLDRLWDDQDEQQQDDPDADRQGDHGCLPPRCPSVAAVAGASVGSTLSFNPSISTTRTWSPLRGVPRTDSAVQFSEATWTTPVGLRSLQHDALEPDELLVPRGRAPMAQPHRRADHDQEEQRGEDRDRDDHERRDRDARHRRVEQVEPAEHQAHHARDRRQADARVQQLEHEEHDRGDEQDHPDDLDRQHPERDQRGDEHQDAERPDDPAGDEELGHDERQAEPEEDEGEVRVQERVEEAGEEAHRVLGHGGARHVERDGFARDLDRHPVHVREERGHVRGDQVDHPELQRLLGRGALGVPDRRLRPDGVPVSSLGDAHDVLRRVVHGLLRGDGAGQPDRLRRADVGGRRHRGDVRRQQDERAGGGRPGPRRRDVPDHRDLRVQDRLRDLPHRRVEPAGRVERQQHGGGARVGGVGDAALDVVGHEGVDDAVDPQLDDLGGAGLRDRAVGSERHARRRQAGEHRCASEDHHVTAFIIAPARTDGAVPCSA